MVESSRHDSQLNHHTVSTRAKARENLVNGKESNDRLERPHVSLG